MYFTPTNQKYETIMVIEEYVIKSIVSQMMFKKVRDDEIIRWAWHQHKIYCKIVLINVATWSAGVTLMLLFFVMELLRNKRFIASFIMVFWAECLCLLNIVGHHKNQL